jgi:hypothetical protein
MFKDEIKKKKKSIRKRKEKLELTELTCQARGPSHEFRITL